MTITIERRQRSKRKQFYIYFNDWTGEIISVGQTPRDDTPAPLLVTDDENAARIIKGLESSKSFVVSSDRRNEEKLVRKSEYLQLRKQEDSLFLVPGMKLDNWDIRIKLYSQNDMLVIESNRSMISKLVAHNMRREIQLDTRVFFEFYLTKKDSLDFLVKVISVDAKTLINHNRVSLPIRDIMSYVDIKDISILTRRFFENYYFEIVDDHYVDNTEQEVQKRINGTWQLVNPEADGHIEIVQSKNVISIRSTVTADQLTDIGIHDRNLTFYIVGDTPDHYLDHFNIDITKIRMGKHEKFAVDFDLMETNIMYRNPALKVIKRNEV